MLVGVFGNLVFDIAGKKLGSLSNGMLEVVCPHIGHQYSWVCL